MFEKYLHKKVIVFIQGNDDKGYHSEKGTLQEISDDWLHFAETIHDLFDSKETIYQFDIKKEAVILIKESLM